MEIRRTGKRRSPDALKLYRDKCTADGVRFDSVLEREHYSKLKALQKAGRIAQLRLQPKFVFVVDGVRIGSYTADFSYTDADGKLRVEDVKAWKRTSAGTLAPIVSREFKYQKALVFLQFGVTVEVV